jgi:parallel beta-helix repeat protein
VGSGYQYTSIQEAVGAAGEGDTIIVHDGTYDEAVGIEKDNITLRGDGAILDGGAPNFRGFVILGRTGVTIEGFEIHNLDAGMAGVTLEPGSNANLVRNNTIISSGDGIWIGPSFGLPAGNIIKLNDIQADGRGIGLGATNGNWILNNFIHDSGIGVFLEGSFNNSILNNLIVGSSDSNVSLLNSSANWVIGNKIVGGNKAGIVLTGSGANEISKNHISGPRLSGILLRNASDYNVVKKNKIFETGSRGIGLSGVVGNDILGNDIKNSGTYGIQVYGGSNGNTIKENVVKNSNRVDLFDATAPELQNEWEDNKYSTDNF